MREPRGGKPVFARPEKGAFCAFIFAGKREDGLHWVQQFLGFKAFFGLFIKRNSRGTSS